MRVLFAGGGTGGHLYPGLAIARAMQRIDPGVKPFFIGAERGIERTVLPSTEFPHELLDLHPLYRSRPWENWKTLRGATTAWSRLGEIVSDERPAVVVGTGGYASGIALAYAAMHGIPYAVQEQNSFPGLTTKFFSRYARQVHNGFPEAASHLKPGKRTQLFDSGNPIEPPPDPRPDKSLARVSWGFPPTGGRVMLIYGGSQGSKAINDVVAAWVKIGIPDDLFVIWATGRNTHADYASLETDRVRIRAYLSPMIDAYSATDFALSRGGAMATAELCAWGIPPIVIPLPTAAADHQTANARALAAAGAAEFIRQSDLTVESLDRSVRALLNDPSLLEQRSAAVLKRARPHAAEEIARHILAVAAA
ncbi:MAG: UDP-N-acetylglucosamine--N-acetylmuramyl-(pentapeptide) pyrophosphoryl-undecaprenol N-acetylglucosamine transferase [Gemmatimonadales bacterium]